MVYENMIYENIVDSINQYRFLKLFPACDKLKFKLMI